MREKERNVILGIVICLLVFFVFAIFMLIFQKDEHWIYVSIFFIALFLIFLILCIYAFTCGRSPMEGLPTIQENKITADQITRQMVQKAIELDHQLPRLYPKKSST